MSIETGGVPIEAVTARTVPQLEEAATASVKNLNASQAGFADQKTDLDKIMPRQTAIIIEPPKPLIGSYRSTGDGLSEFAQMILESADVMATMINFGITFVQQAAISAASPLGQVGSERGEGGLVSQTIASPALPVTTPLGGG